jgi:fructose-1-phosphate kinase PfkB-like protein
MYDICTIGHITLDKVVTAQSVKYMPGGTSFYFSKALRQFDLKYMLVTALAEEESHIVAGLRDEKIEVFSQNSPYTVYFENIYSANQDHREQNVLHKAAPFTVAQMPAIDAKIFHLGPLLSDDITVDL